MEIVLRICLVISGIINFIPSILAFFPNKITQSYGVEVPNANYELLLRHRAISLGIIGGLLIYSAISKRNYDLVTIVGLVSMVSFVVLYNLIGGEINSELSKVMKIDLFAIVVLLIGYLLYKFN